MARKLRNNNPLFPLAESFNGLRIYKVIAYVRLSVEDSGKGTSDSIENQKALILDYIERQPDMELSALYCDNGATGTDFDRPGFDQLMQDLKSGVADCVVVKDLSRFGRNYIETGNYLERVFPFLGVRFVSVTDCFDTLNAERSADGYIVPLKNLINHIYAKDISRKVGTALAAKQRSGEFIGGRPSYGYQKDPQNKNHLIIDEVAAPVVKNIFEWYARGWSINEIICKLEQTGIPSPGQHHHALGIVKSEKYTKSKWCDRTIRDMLRHEVYIGNLVQGRRRKSLFEGVPTTKLSKEKWIIVQDTHEAIVSREVFHTVQHRLDNAQTLSAKNRERLSSVETSENLLKGLLFCGECGAAFHRHRVVRTRKTLPKHRIWYQYYCSTHANNLDACAFTSIREDDVLEAVFLTLKAQISAVQTIKDLLVKLQNSPEMKRQKATCHSEKIKLQTGLNDIAKYSKGVFESYYAGVINEQDFIALSESYEKEREVLKEKLDACIETEKSEVDRFYPQSPWITAFEQFQNETALSREMVLALVQRIEVAQDRTITITLNYRDEYMAACKELVKPEVRACG